MKFSTLLLVLLLSPWFCGKLAAEDPTRPNILYFYVDDLGWGSIGPNGQAERRENGLPAVQTPNLDRLAAQGVNFSRGYGCFVCSPARSSQQSGFHQGHTYADRNDPNNARKAMRADDILMGDALSAAGYATGYWGKWGFGGSKDLRQPQIDNVQTLPTSHGYQHVLAELHHVRAHTFFQPTLWHAPAPAGQKGGVHLVPNSMARYRDTSRYPATPALQNHPDYPETAYCDDSYAFAALDFVRTQAQNYRETGQPFFGLLGVQIPHAPFDEITQLPEWDRAYADDPHFDSLADQSRQWAAMVTRIDAHFGNILTALEDPNHDGDTSDSIADNTLVIFQSDNGGPGGKSLQEYDSNGGLRGTKGDIYEGGIRVPLVMRWPAEIHDKSTLKAGSNVDMPVDVTDLLPTFCELAGVAPPLGVDGVSIAPTLQSRPFQRRRDFLIHEAGRQHSIIRGDFKLVRSQKGELELYQLEADPAESDNLVSDYPELTQELERLLLGERVTEPKGFANTYHRWQGADGQATSDPAHWSNYRYANDGVTYMLDDGPPQASWVARVINKGERANTAKVDQDLEVLAIEVRGDASTGTGQSLELQPGVDLNGRNEIRVGSHGTISVAGGTVSSLRWLEIASSGRLVGDGNVDATVYNAGLINVGGDQSDATLQIDGDLYQQSSGTLQLPANARQASLRVDGKASLGGTLRVRLGGNGELDREAPITILAAEHITGKFDNASDEVIADDGTRLQIEYHPKSVSLRPR